MSVKEQLAINSELIRAKSTNKQLKIHLKEAIKLQDTNYWQGRKLRQGEFKKLQADNKRLKEGLISVRKSTEIMEARRFAEAALKEK